MPDARAISGDDEVSPIERMRPMSRSTECRWCPTRATADLRPGNVCRLSTTPLIFHLSGLPLTANSAFSASVSRSMSPPGTESPWNDVVDHLQGLQIFMQEIVCNGICLSLLGKLIRHQANAERADAMDRSHLVGVLPNRFPSIWITRMPTDGLYFFHRFPASFPVMYIEKVHQGGAQLRLFVCHAVLD